MATKPTLPPSIWAENRPTLPPTTDSQWGQGLQYTSTTSGGKALTETFDYPLFKIDESLRWLRDLFDDDGAVNSLPDATTSQKGVVEKATTTEAESGASGKFPDAAGVHSAFNQYGIGTLSVSEVFDFNDLFPSGIYKITSDAGNPPSPDWMGGFVFRCSRDGGKIVSDLSFDGGNRLYYRAVQGSTDMQDADWQQLLSSSSEQQIGVNQSWQDLTSSRSAGVNYTNNTGKPIMVYIALGAGGGSNNAKFATVDGVGVGRGGAESGQPNQFIVPDGSVYSVDTGFPIEYWSELR